MKLEGNQFIYRKDKEKGNQFTKKQVFKEGFNFPWYIWIQITLISTMNVLVCFAFQLDEDIHFLFLRTSFDLSKFSLLVFCLFWQTTRRWNQLVKDFTLQDLLSNKEYGLCFSRSDVSMVNIERGCKVLDNNSKAWAVS